MIPRASAHVKRYHTVPTIGQQTVAEHSFHVAMLCLEIQKINNKECSAELLKAALFHDLPEHKTGDVPATAKWGSPGLKTLLDSLEDDVITEYGLEVALTIEETLILKYADSLELVMYCIDQMNLGNKNAQLIASRGLVFANTLPYNTGARQLLATIQGEYDVSSK
jgi:5'-deoxynucleotidase YfbR-like HD superfamily hydrolase